MINEDVDEEMKRGITLEFLKEEEIKRINQVKLLEIEGI